MGIMLPAETWMDLSEAYSAMQLAEFRGPPPGPVQAKPYRDGLYTVISMAYGPWNGHYWGQIKSWRLVPESLWDGITIHSYQDAGRDLTGLKVRFRKKTWVCAEPADFLAGLPKQSMSLQEAQEHDADCRSGWRKLWFRNPEISWHSLSGHPVVRYMEGNRCVAVLFWKYQSRIEEIYIADHIDLEPPDDSGYSIGEQLTLFDPE